MALPVLYRRAKAAVKRRKSIGNNSNNCCNTRVCHAKGLAGQKKKKRSRSGYTVIVQQKRRTKNAQKRRFNTKSNFSTLSDRVSLVDMKLFIFDSSYTASC